LGDTVVVRLGGSFITRKDGLFTFREKEVKEAVSAMKGTGRDFAIIHGGDSFGHPAAKRSGLSGGTTPIVPFRASSA
jgi:isopentenyl phosphate kinase